MRALGRRLRQATKLTLLGWILLTIGPDYFFRRGWRFTPLQRAQWLQRCCRRLARGLNCEIRAMGELPHGGFIAPNHLGYLDIIVLGSILPQVFLSRADVASWPMIGPYTKMAGTLFIDRERRSDVANKEAHFAQAMEAGLALTFFLEGTSSDGSEVLPFRASLLGPLAKRNWPITPAYIGYKCEGGDAGVDVCWWGDMGFGSHLARMAGLKRIVATVAFGPTRTPHPDRKRLAEELRDAVLSLKAESAR